MAVSDRFSCPIKTAWPDALDLPRSCSTVKKKMNALKQHIKHKHTCNCGDGQCQNVAHLTEQQLDKIAITHLRQYRSYRHQWIAICKIVRPGVEPLFLHNPTSQQLLQRARDPPQDILETLERLSDEEQLETPDQSRVPVTLALRLFRKYVGVFSRPETTIGSEPIPEPDRDSTVPSFVTLSTSVRHEPMNSTVIQDRAVQDAVHETVQDSRQTDSLEALAWPHTLGSHHQQGSGLAPPDLDQNGDQTFFDIAWDTNN